ncbi:protein obstructor-E-like [Diorhabda sublineata]|uniref:protein obstructor-E-like n=1 Tax=Diorhabda sublineata TaxID=1163346 RepID=UPI0024E0B32B|nr:protein obstructor-E-like [Diorhabda sublineata]
MSMNSYIWTFVFVVTLALGVSSAKNRNRKPQSDPIEDVSEISDQCPEPDGYFADAEQCDKYYHCNNGKITEKLCPDGQVFNDYSSEYEKCDLPFNIDCSSRPKLQEPQPSEHCPRKHGYFAHESRNICDKFYFCVDGKFNPIQCPNGLVYNEKSGICSWPDEAKRSGCTSEEVFEFQCPKVTEEVAITHPRYADPDDCQYFFVCINGNAPRRNGCKLGQVFDDVGKRCTWARNVPECADWYKGRLTDEQLMELENPPTPRPKATKVSKRKQRPHPQQNGE